MPVAVLEKGTRADSRTLTSCLADLGRLVAEERVQSPALIVVGDVVRQIEPDGIKARFAPELETIA